MSCFLNGATPVWEHFHKNGRQSFEIKAKIVKDPCIGFPFPRGCFFSESHRLVKSVSFREGLYSFVLGFTCWKLPMSWTDCCWRRVSDWAAATNAGCRPALQPSNWVCGWYYRRDTWVNPTIRWSAATTHHWASWLQPASAIRLDFDWSRASSTNCRRDCPDFRAGRSVPVGCAGLCGCWGAWRVVLAMTSVTKRLRSRLWSPSH